jgi:hypothetical protein
MLDPIVSASISMGVRIGASASRRGGAYGPSRCRRPTGRGEPCAMVLEATTDSGLPPPPLSSLTHWRWIDFAYDYLIDESGDVVCNPFRLLPQDHMPGRFIRHQAGARDRSREPRRVATRK